MNAVIYTRYSSHNQREESIEDQTKVCNSYAEREGLTVIKCYSDAALTGKRDNRPQFQKLIRDSEKGLFSVVLVYKTDRFARNRFDALKYRQLLQRNGVKLVSVTEAIPDTPEGIIMESFLDGIAEYYSAVLSQNIRRGMEGNAERCMANGVKLYGYRIVEGRYEPDPDTAPIVKRIFEEAASGKRLKDITDGLNHDGILNIRGNKWQWDSLKRMLVNDKYRGVYSFKDVRIEGGMPRLIDDETFSKVAYQVKLRRKGGEHHPFTYTGKSFCKECGATIAGRTTYNAQGKPYRYYCCNNNNNGDGCSMGYIPQEELEGVVDETTLAIVQDPQIIEQIADAVMQYKDELTDDDTRETLTASIKTIERDIGHLVDAIAHHGYTAALGERMAALEDEKARLELRLIEEQDIMPDITRDHIIWWLSRGVSEDILESLVSKVTVGKGEKSRIYNIEYNLLDTAEKRRTECVEYPSVRFSGVWWSFVLGKRTCRLQINPVGFIIKFSV